MSRLIDADALVNIFNRYYGNDEIEVDDVLGWINEQPTIEERKTGKWIKMSDADGEYFACSACGEDLPRYSSEIPTWDKPYPHKRSIDKTDYCPNCGADMRGGKNV